MRPFGFMEPAVAGRTCLCRSETVSRISRGLSRRGDGRVRVQAGGGAAGGRGDSSALQVRSANKSRLMSATSSVAGS